MAQEPQPSASVVLLMFDPEQPGSIPLVSAIESHLMGLAVMVEREPIERSEILTWLEAGRSRVQARKALGLFAIDTRQRDTWRLFFLGPDGPPTLIRRLQPRPEYAPLDQAGVIVRLLVEALLDGKQVGMVEPVPRDEPAQSSVSASRPAADAKATDRSQASSAPAPDTAGAAADSDEVAPETRAQTSEGVRVAIAAGLSSTSWVVDKGWQFGALTGLGLRWKSTSLTLDYAWYPKLTHRVPEASISLSRHPLTARLAYRPAPGFSPLISLGAWLDPVTRSTLNTDSAHRSTASATSWSWGVVASAGVVTPRLASLSARLDLSVELAGRRVQYVVQSDNPGTLLTARSVRSVVSAILDYDL